MMMMQQISIVTPNLLLKEVVEILHCCWRFMVDSEKKVSL